MEKPSLIGARRWVLLLFLCGVWTFGACQIRSSRDQAKFEYQRILRLVEAQHQTEAVQQDSMNFFDGPHGFDPFHDSLEIALDSLMRYMVMDSLGLCDALQTQTASTPINLHQAGKVDTQGINVAHSLCRQKDCRLWARVSKEKQRLFLYLDGQLVDSFKVSTGLSGEFETPSFDVRPSGPVFRRYTSRKFPGGNYMGLGNMPYAVFFSGGFAIHGTTQGNIPRLGTRASHGCIRLHPDNARLFFELVQSVGLRNTWVTIL